MIVGLGDVGAEEEEEEEEFGLEKEVKEEAEDEREFLVMIGRRSRYTLMILGRRREWTRTSGWRSDMRYQKTPSLFLSRERDDLILVSSNSFGDIRWYWLKSRRRSRLSLAAAS
jgi:hypothetical protein